MPSASWRRKVYHLPVKTKSTKDWQEISKIIKARDKHRCQSCSVKLGLTVHHIIPREENGKDEYFNLITLCSLCHNDIEELGIRTKTEIKNFKKRKYIKHTLKDNNPSRAIRWQQWVYGMYKKPK